LPAEEVADPLAHEIKTACLCNRPRHAIAPLLIVGAHAIIWSCRYERLLWGGSISLSALSYAIREGYLTLGQQITPYVGTLACGGNKRIARVLLTYICTSRTYANVCPMEI